MRGMADERFEVQRTIKAAPEEIFAVLRDPRGHVAIDSAGMLMSALRLIRLKRRSMRSKPFVHAAITRSY